VHDSEVSLDHTLARTDVRVRVRVRVRGPSLGQHTQTGGRGQRPAPPHNSCALGGGWKGNALSSVHPPPRTMSHTHTHLPVVTPPPAAQHSTQSATPRHACPQKSRRRRPRRRTRPKSDAPATWPVARAGKQQKAPRRPPRLHQICSATDHREARTHQPRKQRAATPESVSQGSR